MGTAYTRARKIAWFMPRIKAAMSQDLIIKEDKLISEFALFFSSTKRTALEILDQLEGAGRIKRTKGEVWTPEHLETNMILNKSQDNDENKKEGNR